MVTAVDGSPLLDLDLDLASHLSELDLDETDDEDEPVLRWKDGRIVDTWRGGFPTPSGWPGPSTRSSNASSRSSS